MSTTKKFIAKNGLDNNSNIISNVADPVNAQDAATKNFSSNASNLTSGTISSTLMPSFSGDITTSAGSTVSSLTLSGVSSGTYSNVTVNAKGLVTAGSNAATITSGTINNTPIGETTPSTGSFTTIASNSGVTLTGSASANSSLLTYNGSGASLQLASAYTTGSYAAGATAGSFVLRNIGDGTTADDIILAGASVKIGASTAHSSNYPTVLTVDPALVTIAQPASLSSTLTVGNNIIVGQSNTSSVGIELGNIGTTATSPYINFHSGSTAGLDYDSRIIATGGNTSAGGGAINVIAAGGLMVNTMVGVTNPTATTATLFLTYINDIPSIRYGGTGAGSANGFQICGSGNIVKFSVDESGNGEFSGTVTASGGSFTNRPTFNGNTPYDTGNLTPSNPPTQLSSVANNTTNSTFWMEEVENTGEGYISFGGIGSISTAYDKQMTLYARDSSGNKYFCVLQRR